VPIRGNGGDAGAVCLARSTFYSPPPALEAGVAGDFIIDFSAQLAGADQEARAPRVWADLLPLLGRWYADGGPFAAALWLADDEDGRRFTLWLAHNSVEGEATPQPYCVSVAADRDGAALERVFDDARDQWVSRGFGAPAGDTLAVPLQYRKLRDDHAAPQTLGAVTLFGNFESAGAKTTELKVVAEIAGSWLRLNREARITRALGDLQAECQGVKSSTDLAALIGNMLKVHASAHVKWQVLVPDGAALLPLAGWHEPRQELASTAPIGADSPLYRFHFDQSDTAEDRAIVRFDGRGDAFEMPPRWKDCGLRDLTGLEPNGDVVTVLIQRVRDRMTANPDDKPPVIASFLLASGPTDGFAGGLFSRTNLRILEHIGDYFRTSYAALLERERMAEINKMIIGFQSVPDMMDDAADLAHLRAFAKITRDVVPSVIDAVILELRHDPRRESYYRSDGGSGARPEWFGQALPKDRIVPSARQPNRFLLRRTIRRSEGGAKAFDLVMELSSGSLSVVEETLLERIVAEILATMNLHLDQEKWAIQLAEVRHNLRSVVTSLLGKTAKIVEGYEAARTAPPEIAYDRLVNRAAFHKSTAQLKYAAEELRALTENIRTISGGGSRIPLQITSIDLPEMISECLNLFTEEMSRRGLSCDYENQLPYQLRMVDGDRGWLHILIFNLVENAVKYSRQGRRIEMRLWLQGPFWRFSVANEGKHIPPKMLSSIFEPYVRIEPEPGEQAMPGTGIGLASVKTIAKLHQMGGLAPPGGAPVTVSSQLIGGGSSSLRNARTLFTISIPRKLGGSSLHGE
jgi:signal transduction histidine kinase